MPDSIRQQIIAKIETRFQGILKSGGYQSDVGFNIFINRSSALQDSELPGVVVRFPNCETIRRESHRHRMNIECNICVADGDNTETLLGQIIDDIQAAIGVDTQWDQLAINTDPIGWEIATLEQLDRKLGGARISFVIEFRTSEWNPYAF